jgi:hypothetical protein
MAKFRRTPRSDRKILDEVICIRKLLLLQLVALKVSPSAIGEALGITDPDKVRELIPVRSIRRK